MLSINTNLSSLIAQRSMKQSTLSLNTAIERMTTGFKINHSKDNAANYSIATNMTTKIGSLQVAEDNCAMGLDMITTASDTLSGIDDKLVRLRSLATQASNGTYGDKSLEAINTEANALVDEINRIYETAEYNGLKLFKTKQSSPTAPIATFGMTRASTSPPSYTDEEVSAMTKLADVTSLTAGEKYSISTIEELEKLANFTNSKYDTTDVEFVLANDLDLSSISNWTPIGSESSYFFKGTFDGNGHVIENLTINNETKGYQGLFGGIAGATIKNLGIVNAQIKGRSDVGGLVGMILSKISPSTIEKCYVTGNITATEDVNSESYVGGLVGRVAYNNRSCLIENCYTNTTVYGDGEYAGGLIGYIESKFSIINCYALGDVTNNTDSAGGLIGYARHSSSMIKNCYSKGDVVGDGTYIGGLIGYNFGGTISDCYAMGNVINPSNATNYWTGSLIGYTSGSEITNCNASGSATGGMIIGKPGSNISNTSNLSEEQLLNKFTPEYMGYTEVNGWTIVNSEPLLSWQREAQPVVPMPDPDIGGEDINGGDAPSAYITGTIVLQIGGCSNSDSQISLDLGFSLGTVDNLRMIGLDTTTDFLDIIDEMIATVNAKEVEYGAAQNRLISALEGITVQRENLISSRSTLRDADIADISSEYIRQQILQQASATLLSTANQSASIALSLI